MSKKYYWLKLKNTYFNQLTQKKMKRQPNGKEMQIIYLRMLLSSIDKEGKIYYQGVYDSLEEELAEEFDESIEIVKQTIRFLIDNNMVTIDDSFNCYIPEAAECIGSEWDSAERMRKKRNLDKASQCDNDVTHSDDDITLSDIYVTSCDTEIEKREEKELERESEERKEDGDKSTTPSTGILLPLNDKTFYDVPVDKISMWEKTYPAVNVRQELQKMIAWLDANPERKKTRRGIAAFINRWLSKEQDNGGYHYQRKEEKTSSALPYANEPDPVYHWPKAAVDFCADDADEQFERYMQQKEERKWRERMMQDTSQHAE